VLVGVELTGSVLVTSVVVVVLSLQPNQPGVSQVEVEVDVVMVLVAGTLVVSSKQPHQPGVWQVEVLVLVLVEVGTDDVVVVVIGSVPLLSYIFHWAQSLHSGLKAHWAGSS
jgi:hypothetical protein